MADFRWEYCSLERRTSHTKSGGYHETTTLVYYGTHSFTETVDSRAWGRAVGQLGEDGWEMVSTAATYNVDGDEVGGTIALYFKRRAGKTIQRPVLANL
jgi:hypothetical protein